MKRNYDLLRVLLTAALCVCLTLPAAAQTFPDVPANHWAYHYIERAAADGAVKGYANGTFAPVASLSLAHFTIILARSFYADDLERAASGSSELWYAPAERVAKARGLLSGVSADMGDPLSRYNMAVELYNVLQDHKCTVSDSAISKSASSIRDLSKFPSQSVRDAVLYVYALGILGGYSDGTFGGDNILNRAQAAAIYCRLKDVIKALPEKPEETGPVDVPTPGKDESADKRDDNEKPIFAPEPEDKEEPVVTPTPTPPDDKDDNEKPVVTPEPKDPVVTPDPGNDKDPVVTPEPGDDNDRPVIVPEPGDDNDQSVVIPGPETPAVISIRRK